MAELTSAQTALLTELADVWLQERDGFEQARRARARAGELLDSAHAAGVPVHFVAHAYLRARSRRTNTRNMRRAQAALRKRRERFRDRDRASREPAAAP